jgi:hypothetical protein
MKTIIALLTAAVLSGCAATPPGLRVQPSEVTAEDQRTVLAKLVLANQASGTVSAFKAEVVNATISQPRQVSGSLFHPEPHTFYCVRGEIKNPLFPLNQPFHVEIRVFEKDGQKRYRTSGSRYTACSLGNEKPFPELESLSLLR